MVVAGLRHTLTCPNRIARDAAGTGFAPSDLSQLSSRLLVVSGRMGAMCLTFFGFTLGLPPAGGAGEQIAKGAISSVLLGGVRA